MSDTEVTVTQNTAGTWWRLEYKGKYDFLDEAPTEVDKREFRKVVDARARQDVADRRVKLSGHRLMEGDSPNGNWR